MKRGANASTSLFLMELIVVICFFALVSVVCVRLFVAASVINTRSVNIDHGARIEESLAQVWTAYDGDLEAVAGTFPGAVCDARSKRSGDVTLYFNKDWLTARTKEERVFCVTLTGMEATAREVFGEGADGSLAICASVTSRDLETGEVFHTIDTDHYIGLQAEGGEK